MRTATEIPGWLQYISAAAPLAILVGAVIAGAIGLVTLVERTRADRRDQFWQRLQWAIDAAICTNDRIRQRTGLIVLARLGVSDLCRDEDADLLRDIADGVTAELLAAPVDGTAAPDDNEKTAHEEGDASGNSKS
ncbi:hypothetical protein [Paenarthrobacter sp. PH39-S1]|uniref:hypothetical protein n=1 Tax=Paenarthrobacter sp. PH39-S1 TaxID=3046204 RepID=UPI0024B9B5A5|nr:hypothetical protein [Paenarthrobacter sp. PH39-S1]MDJ0354533.1 hypothetical protein [Paenarthrobacter sp. PH39-S1]